MWGGGGGKKEGVGGGGEYPGQEEKIGPKQLPAVGAVFRLSGGTGHQPGLGRAYTLCC